MTSAVRAMNYSLGERGENGELFERYCSQCVERRVLISVTTSIYSCGFVCESFIIYRVIYLGDCRCYNVTPRG